MVYKRSFNPFIDGPQSLIVFTKEYIILIIILTVIMISNCLASKVGDL